MKYLSIGIVAHVDAGKTTLSESLMYGTGKLKDIGRVDKGDAFLDTDEMEKERGITIFSKQAVFNIEDIQFTLLDTPGHVDFSAEAERVLSVLDAAVLVVSRADGVQSHTRTLWKLLSAYNIPTLIFVNKMDQPGDEISVIIEKLRKELAEGVTDFSGFKNKDYELYENIASLDEKLIEKFLLEETLSKEDICELFRNRKLFPTFFGAALKNEGVEDFILSMGELFSGFFDNAGTLSNPAEEFSARVFKISRDAKEERLTHLKILSGSIRVKGLIGEEKINGIRLYDGAKFENLNEAYAGQVVALTGLSETYAGQGIGAAEADAAVLLPVLSYRLILPEGIDSSKAVAQLMNLAEEQPDLFLEYDGESKTIDIRLMGQVQTEILSRRIKERFGYYVTFGEKRILYKETISNLVEGIGHFEPLRHYAEVHLLLEPAEPGEGMVFELDCSEDILDRNWQRLILTHLKERSHRGVLTGAPITDIKITVVSGRAHVKHTEGGDFRQATYRAVRHGLMQAESHLLEPYYDFVLDVPTEFVGRAMTDLERLCAKDFLPETLGDITRLSGNAPVSKMADYAREVASYTRGLGQLALTVRGYGPCHNEKEVLEASSYKPENDIRNTPDSVFCSHGSGVVIPWNEVKAMAHMPSVLEPVKELTDEQIRNRAKTKATQMESGFLSVEEVDSIIDGISANRKPEFVPHKGINHLPARHKERSESIANTKKASAKPAAPLPKCLLVDGYNLLHASSELSALAKTNLDSARDRLLDILCDYQGMMDIKVIAVFDAYRLHSHPEEYLEYNNIHVVFTRTAQTADYYIERFTKEKSSNFQIRVITSDTVEGVIVSSEKNAHVTSSTEFWREFELFRREFHETHGVS